MVKASDTGGVKPMPIAGRYVAERERLLGMTDAERVFRQQWLKDQILSPDEPKPVPEMYRYFYNPIRRFYRWPLDKMESALQPSLGVRGANIFRYFTGKAIMTVIGAYWVTYYFKYHGNDWTTKGGWRVKQSRTACLEGDEGYPRVSDRTKGSDYADRGFSKLKLNL